MDRKVEAYAAAKRILDELNNTIKFDRQDLYGMMDQLDKVDNLFYAYGSSRCVIWDNCYDYVIKIAFEGYEYYNKHEVAVYDKAVEEGWEENFGWCECYEDYHIEDDGSFYPGIYVMEFLEGDEEVVTDSVWETGYKYFCEEHGYDNSNYDHADEYNEIVDYDSHEIFNCMTDEWDIKDKIEFEDFLCENDVNDLHCANYLFRNDRLVICDYAGW